MKDRIIRKSMVFVIIILFLLVGINPSSAIDTVKESKIPFNNGNTLYVGGSGQGNYTYIQDAVDNASDGDTVFVYIGVYVENIIVDKSINLIGENRDSTIIDGNYSGNVVNISMDWVNINGFTIQRSEQHYPHAGISLQSNNNNISYNIISNNEHGIYLDKSNNNTITGNNILNNVVGIDFRSSSNSYVTENNISNKEVGIHSALSNNNIITDNNIYSNFWHGIFIWGSRNNVITGNIISNNKAGINLDTSSNSNTISNNSIYSKHDGVAIEIYDSNSNTITCNTISSDSALGLGVHLSCNNNIIYHNNFINNRVNAYGGGSTIWDNGYPSGGNYWDDYTGNDSDGDGIGDIPYFIYPSGEDRYPLMVPYGNQPPGAPEIDGEKGVVPLVEFNYYFTAIDPEGDDVRFHIDWGDGTSNITGFYKSGETVTVGHIYYAIGTVFILAYAEDIHGACGPESTYMVEWKSKSVNLLLIRLLEHFPFLNLLLQMLRI